jgi:hypothetical protein
VDGVVISGDGLRKELFYVAASRGREAISVVTSNRELLRETIAHSDIRQSASDLALKGRLRPVEQPQHLRKTYSSGFGELEHQTGTTGRTNGLTASKDRLEGQAAQVIDQNQEICQPTHQQLLEPSHSLGMSH